MNHRRRRRLGREVGGTEHGGRGCCGMCDGNYGKILSRGLIWEHGVVVVVLCVCVCVMYMQCFYSGKISI